MIELELYFKIVAKVNADETIRRDSRVFEIKFIVSSVSKRFGYGRNYH